MSERDNVGTSATVQLTLSLSVPSSYGADWKLDDMHQQIEQEAETAVRAFFREHSRWRIIELEVTTVTAITSRRKK